MMYPDRAVPEDYSLMKALPKSRRFVPALNLSRSGLLFALLLLSTILSAQTVQVSVPGVVSRTTITRYSDKYVIGSMDYGFIWLDSTALTSGYVGVLGKCVGSVAPPAPVTNFY